MSKQPKQQKQYSDRVKRTTFTEDMKKDYTILIPDMLPIHFNLIIKAYEHFGYKMELLTNTSRNVVDEGLKNTHNDTCYPALLVIGQYMDALSKESGAYDAIRLDWARYGEDGLDDMLIAFMEGLDDFDKSMSGAMKDEDYVRTALENIMDERGMTDEQRTSFLKTMQTYASQSGMDSLRDALDGHKENVMRALVQMSEAAPAEKGKANTQAAMDEICQSARRRQREERREMLQNLTGDKADEEKFKEINEAKSEAKRS